MIPAYLFGRGFEWLAPHLDGWQFGECGAIAALASKLGGELKEKTFCEFGCGDPEKQGFTCARLVARGWGGILFDYNAANVEKAQKQLGKWPRVTVAERKLSPRGVDSLDSFYKSLEFIPDVLVIDVDNNEHEFLGALEMRPSIICIEHHDLCDEERGKFPPIPEKCGQRIAERESFIWQATHEHLRTLAFTKDYALALRTRINSIFVRAEDAEKFQQPMRLDIGCGSRCKEGWIAIDRKVGIDALALPFEDSIAEEIYASHVLEHFSRADSRKALTEWVRVLKSGGLIRIAVPNLDYILENQNHPHFEGWLMGGQLDEDDFHCCIFWKEKLEALMDACGLVDIKPWSSDAQDCAALPVSLNLQGIKP